MYSSFDPEFKRVNKTRAAALLEKGKEVYICPCRCWPDSCGKIDKKTLDSWCWTFAEYLNAATFYGCNREVGRYLAYYIAI